MFPNQIKISNEHTIYTALYLKRPYIALFNNFLTHAECDSIIELSKPELKRSHVINPKDDGTMVDDSRTSLGMFFQRCQTDLITTIESRIANLVNIPIQNGEGLQILNYKIGGEYKPHHDYFKPNEKGESPHTKIGGQRVATFIIYLNNVEDGGSTIFPTLGVEFFPIKGSALFFHYQLDNKDLDIHSLHGGTPVIKGEKWIATKWLREGEFTYK